MPRVVHVYETVVVAVIWALVIGDALVGRLVHAHLCVLFWHHRRLLRAPADRERRREDCR